MQATTTCMSTLDVPIRSSYRKEMARQQIRRTQCSKLQMISQMQFLDKPELELLRLDMDNREETGSSPDRDDVLTEEIVFQDTEEAKSESGRHCNPRRMLQSPKFSLPLPLTSGGISKPTGLSPRSPRGSMSPRLRSPRYQKSHYRPHSVKNEPLQLTDMQLALSSIELSTLQRNYSFNEGHSKFAPSPRSPFIGSPRSAFSQTARKRE